jgi:hypothetical protein
MLLLVASLTYFTALMLHICLNILLPILLRVLLNSNSSTDHSLVFNSRRHRGGGGGSGSSLVLDSRCRCRRRRDGGSGTSLLVSRLPLLVVVVATATTVLFDIFGHDLLPFDFPFSTIGGGVIIKFVTAHAKNATVLELLGQWDDVKVEKAQLAHVPIVGRVDAIRMSILKGSIAFDKEALIPFSIYVPVLNSFSSKEANQSGSQV